MKQYFIFIILVFIPLFLQAQKLYLPLSSGGEMEHHLGYSLEYDESKEQAAWVAYELTREEVAGTIKRKDNFRSDPSISTGSAALSDYKGSGYDRGHLAPAADMKWSDKVMSESFFMSNMSPQDPSFNRGIWKKLEEKVRNWAVENGKILIATGPIYQGSYKSIGSNQVAIPTHYYKVIIDYTKPEFKGIGFIMENKKGSKPLQSYACTINKVEEVTSIDFFYLLPDEIEEKLESYFDTNKWSFGKSASSLNSKVKIQSFKTNIESVPQKYWINSSSNTRHNSGCRYYGKTKSGYYTNKKTGTSCTSCGG